MRKPSRALRFSCGNFMVQTAAHSAVMIWWHTLERDLTSIPVIIRSVTLHILCFMMIKWSRKDIHTSQSGSAYIADSRAMVGLAMPVCVMLEGEDMHRMSLSKLLSRRRNMARRREQKKKERVSK